MQNVVGGLSERYRRLLAQEDRTSYIHLNNARVLAPGVGPLPRGDALAGPTVRGLRVVLWAP